MRVSMRSIVAVLLGALTLLAEAPVSADGLDWYAAHQGYYQSMEVDWQDALTLDHDDLIKASWIMPG